MSPLRYCPACGHRHATSGDVSLCTCTPNEKGLGRRLRRLADTMEEAMRELAETRDQLMRMVDRAAPQGPRQTGRHYALNHRHEERRKDKGGDALCKS